MRKNRWEDAAQFVRLDRAKLLGEVRLNPPPEKLPRGYREEIDSAINGIMEHLEAPPAKVTPEVRVAVAERPPKKGSVQKAVLARAKYRCENCGVAQHAVGFRDGDGTFHPASGREVFDFAGRGLSWPAGERLTLSEAREVANLLNCTIRRQVRCDNQGRHWIVVSLGMVPVNSRSLKSNDSGSFKAMCRQCNRMGENG